MELVLSELFRMDTFRAPRDKLICLLNCCQTIELVVRTVHSQDSGSTLGSRAIVAADDSLPLLIFCVIRYFEEGDVVL